MITVDKSRELSSKALHVWAYVHGVKLDSFDLGNRYGMRFLRVSTGGCGMSFSMPTCLSPCMMHGKRLERVGSIVMRTGLTALRAFNASGIYEADHDNRATKEGQIPVIGGLV